MTLRTIRTCRVYTMHMHIFVCRDAVYMQGVRAGCACRVCMQGVDAAHATRRGLALLRTHGLPRNRASAPPPYRAPGVMARGRGRGRIRVGLLNLSGVERLVIGVGIGLGWGVLISAVSRAGC